MVSDRLDGLKVIADALGKHWRREVSIWAVRRYSRWRVDPLPVVGPKYARAWINRSLLREWARRNRHRRSAPPAPPPTGQTAFSFPD